MENYTKLFGRNIYSQRALDRAFASIQLFWNILIPIAPLLLVVATGLWRNICSWLPPFSFLANLSAPKAKTISPEGYSASRRWDFTDYSLTARNLQYQRPATPSNPDSRLIALLAGCFFEQKSLGVGLAQFILLKNHMKRGTVTPIKMSLPKLL